MKLLVTSLVTALSLTSLPAMAYDGTNCKAPGNCWEPKPNYPEKVEGSQYDPQHDPAELSKQGDSLKAMDNRNAWRIWNKAKTGSFQYDVAKIDGYVEGEAPPAN